MLTHKPVAWRKIGIIGGLGPRASAYFYRLVVDLCSQQYQAVQDVDYPPIVLVSLANGGLSEAGVVTNTAFLAEVKEVLRLFGSLGVGVVTIACNSVYGHFGQFSRYTQIPVVNLAEEIALAAARSKIKDTVILCSQGLRTTRAYDPYFLAKGIEPHYPEESIQILIDQWILEVMGGYYTDQTVAIFLEVVDRLVHQHGAVVLACTELSVFFELSDVPPNVIDSSRILAQATLRSART